MITKINKKQWVTRLRKQFFHCSLFTFAFSVALTSCSDMIETESTRFNIDPEIGDKTDSVFYAYGILEAMQQLADQYVFLGEMRGDLVETTVYTDNNLRQLANFSATTANKYDSAYVYYRVINNCNYYIAHCDTALYRGSTNVIIDKYAATKAIRAWAYMQLGRNYERVPFFTEPLTKISQVDGGNFPEYNLDQLVAALAPDLEQYSGMVTPSLGFERTTDGYNYFDVGSPVWTSTAKRVSPHYLFIPIDVVLGDMYLETEQFDAAARHYVTYLTQVASRRNSPYIAPMQSKRLSTGRFGDIDDDLPNRTSIADELTGQGTWSSIFGQNSMADLVTYIPMAVSRENGCTTEVPLTFGFNYYATSEENARIGSMRDPYVEEIQIVPSAALNTLSDSTEYYYYTVHTNQSSKYDSISIAKCGDMRLRSIIQQTAVGDSTLQWIDKYKYANIILYRKSTVLLHLAEAFNRLGMPDAAFAILKDGICDMLVSSNNAGFYYATYITPETRQKLQTTYPLLSEAYISLFPTTQLSNIGIHCHGAGKAASDGNTTTYLPGVSPYQLDRMAGLKMQEIAEQYGVSVGTTKQDTINAIEDLICDEMALELAFEGSRWYDLKRLARHKNSAGLYSGNFGGVWLARKLAYKNPVKDLSVESNWYLPFK